MKLNNTYCLIGIVILIVSLVVLYYCLGNKVFEGSAGMTESQYISDLAARKQADTLGTGIGTGTGIGIGNGSGDGGTTGGGTGEGVSSL